MTDIRLAFADDATAHSSAYCETIYIRDKNTWIEIAMGKDTAIELRDSLNTAIEKWGERK